MARGQSQTADKQLNLTNGVAGKDQAQSNALEQQLIPDYTKLSKFGYLTPEDAAAAEVSEMGTATQPFQSMQFEAANRAARTNNAADLTTQEDQLALEEGQRSNDAAAKLQQQKMSNQLGGMYGLSGLRAEDLQAATSMYGMGPSTLNARSAGGPGFSWSYGPGGVSMGGH